ncbi:MAG: efflux transporter periplasmic adaptor subunit [Zetaproteobacteria bacterium CG1_02_49_23]|nr:MAG: efflux transporter periplasmic adaptor subunit [Zetaproteobacteria bacterium CG1_02_49_23]
MKKPMFKRMLIMLMIVGAIFGAIRGFQMFVAGEMKKYLAANGQPPATVTAVEVKRELWQQQLTAVGNLRAVQGVDISSEISGMVKKVYFQSGDSVKKGDLLVELNSDEELAQLQSLQASRKLAEITLGRDRQQLKVHAISQAQLDASQAALTNAQAQALRQQAVIDKKSIRAPFDGRLGVSRINEGQFINPAEAIVSLQNSQSLYVDFNLPQKHVAELKVGQSISVYSTQEKDIRIDGFISAINAKVDSNTRNVLVEGKIDNQGGTLLPGMFVNVSIHIGEPKSWLTLPQTAISYNAYGSTLFIATKEKDSATDAKSVAQQVFVKTGDKRGDQVAVLEGLSEGDMVVTSGQLKLKNGTPLIINNSVLPANEAAPKPQEH